LIICRRTIMEIQEDERRQRRRLEREVAALHEQLNEAERQRDEFLGMLAHELRNPLAPLRNGLTILGLPGVSPETAARSRAAMERQLRHLIRLVDDLLEASRITSGKIQLRREPLDLAAVAARAAESARPLFAEHDLRFDVDLPGRPLVLSADPERLAQILANLLENAAKFTPPGGHVQLVVEPLDGQAVVRVIDSGIGVPTEILPAIFDPFVQASRAIDRPLGGLGLGLTLVRRLVEMHGGEVSATSRGPGTGCELRILLPLSGSGGAHLPAPAGAV
jgi:signal transduction histidine kinase